MGVLPDVLKIDVEGAELGVLQGAMEILKRRKPTIFLSTHSMELREACLNLLKEVGYKAEPLVKTAEPHEFLLKAI